MLSSCEQTPAEVALLSVRNVAIERGYRRLLEGIDLDVTRGDLWQLAGANGLGKTSFLRALAGLSRLGVEGMIEHAGTFLYQGHMPGLKPLLTPLENLRWHPSGIVETCDARLFEALAAVGLAGYEETPVHNLSAGQQRRVGLARLWATSATLWLLDEPFTAIDVKGADLLEQRMLEHIDNKGAVIFTSHQPNRFAGRLQVLDLADYAA